MIAVLTIIVIIIFITIIGLFAYLLGIPQFIYYIIRGIHRWTRRTFEKL